MSYYHKQSNTANNLGRPQKNRVSWHLLVVVIVFTFSLQIPLFTQIATAATMNCTSGPLDHGTEDQYSEWDIIFYSKVATACCPPIGAGFSTGSGAVVGSGANAGNGAKVFDYLVKQGLSQVQALGIIGNLMQESGGQTLALNPTVSVAARASGNEVYGIAQWLGGRLATLRSKAAYDTIETQEAFIWEELTNGYRGALMSLSQATSVQEATEIIVRSYEIPCLSGDEACFQKEIRIRTNLGIKAASELGVNLNSLSASALNPNLTVAANSTPVGAVPQSAINTSCVTAITLSAGMSTSVTSLLAKIVEFAWEDGRRGPAQKPAYAEAMSKGLYPGGANGNDCGAFVSAAMVTSGYQPDYPGTDTTHQFLWLQENWTQIYAPGEVDVSKLRPGDVAYKPHHVYIWVGVIPGFNGTIAEAALRSGGGVAPTAVSLSSNTYDTPSKYYFFRKKEAAPNAY